MYFLLVNVLWRNILNPCPCGDIFPVRGRFRCRVTENTVVQYKNHYAYGVKFIYIALLTIQIVSKQLYSIK